jgi:alanine racemase
VAEGSRRPAWVEVDLGAVRHNASVLAGIVAPAGLCAVVKADAYGHGAVPVSLAALAGGAGSLAVAITDEGVELREAGIEAPILLLSEPGADAMDEAIARRLTPTLYSAEGIALAGAAARRYGANSSAGYPVEVKVDTGMHRVGADPDDVVALVQTVADRQELAFAGLWTHLAVADEPDNEVTAEQLRCFGSVRAALAEAGCPEPGRVHAANSAGAIAWPASRFDVARCGIALYGYSPSPALDATLAAECHRVGAGPLEPVLEWKAHVSFVRSLAAGERVSYGLKAPLREDALVATVPLGYADGIPRGYFSGGGEVLVKGRRRPLAGVVTMDQILVDCGGETEVRPGDEVVLIGRQGSEQLTAQDWAGRLDTIAYEVVTRIGSRVPRVHLGSGTAAGGP